MLQVPAHGRRTYSGVQVPNAHAHRGRGYKCAIVLCASLVACLLLMFVCVRVVRGAAGGGVLAGPARIRAVHR
jgi:hypothetical protein